MPSLPTLPTRSWMERASIALAGAIGAIGAFGVIGWWFNIDELIQPFPQAAPIRFNPALCLVLLAGVLLALERKWRKFAALALVPAAAACYTLLEHFVPQLPRIDEFFVRDRLPVQAEYGGRMAVAEALALSLGALAMAWRGSERGERWRLLTEAITGSLIMSAGVSTLLGYLAGVPSLYHWGTDTATSPLSAIALLLLGLALLLLAWRDGVKVEGGPPAWSPLPAVIGCLTLTLILWGGLRERERSFVNEKTGAAMDSLASALKLTLEQQIRQFDRLARGWGDSPDVSPVLWQADAARQLGDSRAYGCISIAYVDETLTTRWIHPREGNEGANGFMHRTDEERFDAIQQARAGRDPVASRTIRKIHYLNGLRTGLVIYAPITRAGRPAGFAAGEYLYQPMFDAIVSLRQSIDRLRSDYHVEVSIAGEVVYRSAADDRRRDPENTIERTYNNLANRNIHLSVAPSRAALEKGQRYLPELALGAGFGISLLLGLSIHLARSARAGQRSAEHSNRRLSAENDERRRVEARLKVSDERLRLALDSTQIGIFEWSVPAGHVYYSPGLWAMLGFDHTRMPSTVEAWQTLVHPEDLPLYRRRTESQLSGLATFIEPEFRVRTQAGVWRWVYTRSKTVAADAGGKPTRIIGTVQDITARREAEFALRESQTEARKLSLVAAKTDNPVLIGSADGRIEWVNEAFCRVMEYSLEEVVGKNPAHFMIGPETSPRAVVRIRAAMANGHGISTDVVNYSKSGRKYHLHLEIQPVRNAAGQVETFIAVETDITARVETERELRRAKAEADEASRAKSDFLASMSHEIRTPMNGVIGMTSLLMETSLNGEQRDYISTIRTSGEALLTIINDILDFSKIESGKMELERAPFELALCVEEALDLFALQVSSKKLALVYHIAPDVPAWIIGDVTRLRQVLVNLVNNAVKFTPGGSIALEVRRAQREPEPLGFEPVLPAGEMHTILEFTVRDTGIGIPPDRVGRLFQAFSQVDSSTTRKYGGTGLGLAICQRLCILMGGSIRVQSQPGIGSEFTFTITTEPAPGVTESGLRLMPAALREGGVLVIEDNPVAQERLRTLFEKWGVTCTLCPTPAAAAAAIGHLPRPPALVMSNAGPSDAASPFAALPELKCAWLAMYPFGQIAPTPPDDGRPFASLPKPLRTSALIQTISGLFGRREGASTTAETSDHRTIGEEFPLEVLLAEDNAVNQKVALRFLDRLGYRADAVANGLEVLSTLEHRRYDLILMDLQMPEMDGLETSRQIRARLPADRQPKIIALTANAMHGDREVCIAAGMDDYVTKPVKMHEIAAAIRRQFGPSAGGSGSSGIIG